MKKMRLLMMLVFALGLIACSKPAEPNEGTIKDSMLSETEESDVKTIDDLSDDSKELLEKLGIDPESITTAKDFPGITSNPEEPLNPEEHEETSATPRTVKSSEDIRKEILDKLDADSINPEDLDSVSGPFADILRQALNEAQITETEE